MQDTAAQGWLWPLGIMAIGALASLIGGALSGLWLGARDLGPQLAAMMGALFGPLAGVSGIALGLLALALIGGRIA